MKNYEKVGKWWSDKNIELVRIDGVVYALIGWNGESYNNCWICRGISLIAASVEEYDIKPIYDNLIIKCYEVKSI
jgi:hypothetical protein